MNKSKLLPKVGIGVLIFNDNKVLLGQRINSHGGNTWCPPGGHLDFAESWEDCARRETSEEAGIEISQPKFLGAFNDLFIENNKHYVTLMMGAKYLSGKVQVKEPDKCASWQWFSYQELPKPLFLSVEKFFAMGNFPNILQLQGVVS